MSTVRLFFSIEYPLLTRNSSRDYKISKTTYTDVRPLARKHTTSLSSQQKRSGSPSRKLMSPGDIPRRTFLRRFSIVLQQ